MTQSSNTILISQATELAKKFSIEGSPQELVDTLKNTAFKGNATPAQFNALMIVATQYGLNPFTSEIYAFPSNGGITPVVGVDGWARIINGNPQFDGMTFEQDAESCTCKIYRKDRSHPIAVTEFMEECKRPTQPWKSHPRRMLRHKAMIQAARLAFGFSGIYDEDEAERIDNAKNNIAEGEANPFKGDTESESRAALIATGEAVAQRGTDELRRWFESISKEDRKILGVEELERLKGIAAQTINAEVVEETEQ